MKKKLFILLTTFSFIIIQIKGNTQEATKQSDDISRIAINAYCPQQVEKLSPISSDLLLNKLNQITTQYGLGSDGFSNRFIITSNINVLSKEVTSTAPAMIVLDLEISFYIGDGVEGIKFASTSINKKGIGTNETKAYNDALKNIKPSDPMFQSFINNAKQKIIQYYTTNCDFILNKAQSLSIQNNYDAAIFTLSQVPTVCQECYNKSMSSMVIFYKKQQNRDCKIKLNEAETVWAASPTIDGAEKAAYYLSRIDPESDCYSKAKSLASKINNKVEKEISKKDARDWKIKLLEITSSIELQKKSLQNIRDISIAYANNQPKVIYKIAGWW